jgi:membrane protein
MDDVSSADVGRIHRVRSAIAKSAFYWWLILKDAAVASVRHGVPEVAKSAAFSALLSFFPVLTTLTAILVQANAHAVSRNLTTLVFRVVPPGTENIVTEIFTERGQRPVFLLITATILSVLGASGVMLSLMEGFRNAYGIQKGRPFLKNRWIAAVLVLAAVVPSVIASTLIVLGRNVEYWLIPSTRFGGVVAAISPWVRYIVAISGIVLATSLMYTWGPNPHRSWRRVLPGAILATALWSMATIAFAWYVRNIADYNVLYGSVGAVIALLIWMYLLAVIALFGCEYNAAAERHENLRGS